MKHPKIIFLLLVAIMAVVGCRKDFKMAPAAVVLPTGNVSFDTVVLPIFTSNCAKSGCHIAGGQSPDLSAANAYNQLTMLGYVPQDDTSDASAKNSTLYKMITSTSKPMPPSSPLTGTQVAQILAWIKQGSLNN